MAGKRSAAASRGRAERVVTGVASMYAHCMEDDCTWRFEGKVARVRSEAKAHTINTTHTTGIEVVTGEEYHHVA